VGGRLSRLPAGWPGSLADLGLIVLVWTAPLVALRPLADSPFVDDWVYAWAVEHLLHTGQLKILDWSVSQDVAHVLWGALFCLPLGFSFTALRLSTWVAALLGLVGLYVLLRELGARRGDALLGVAVLAFYPVYFILSLSFMTDVPFVTAMIWFFVALARALTRSSTRALAAASLLACLAVAVRPVGIVLAGVLVLARWPSSTRWWRPTLGQVVAAAAPVVVLGLLTLARPSLTEYRADLTWVDGSWAWRRQVNFTFAWAQLGGWMLANLTVVVGTLGVALAPLALGNLSRESARVALPVGLLAAAALTGTLLLRGGVGAPLDPEFTWSLRELGATEALVPPLTLAPVRSLAGSAVAMFVATVSLTFALAPLARRGVRAEAGVLAWGALGYFVMGTVLWLFYDRYALPIVPMAVALRLAATGIPRRPLALLGVAMLAAVSGVGTWDHLRYNHALWTAVAWARHAGIDERELDGGYVVNGWLQYAHPERAIRAPNGDVSVSDVNGGRPGRYGIVKRLPPGARVLHAVSYRRLMAPSGRLYVVDRAPTGAAR
jgi:hypothetical protein